MTRDANLTNGLDSAVQSFKNDVNFYLKPLLHHPFSKCRLISTKCNVWRMDVQHWKGMWCLNAHSTTITDFERGSVPFDKLPLVFYW